MIKAVATFVLLFALVCLLAVPAYGALGTAPLGGLVGSTSTITSTGRSRHRGVRPEEWQDKADGRRDGYPRHPRRNRRRRFPRPVDQAGLRDPACCGNSDHAAKRRPVSPESPPATPISSSAPPQCAPSKCIARQQTFRTGDMPVSMPENVWLDLVRLFQGPADVVMHGGRVVDSALVLALGRVSPARSMPDSVSIPLTETVRAS